MFYKNTSYSDKTFYGVTFKPGETKEVNGPINNRWLIPVDDPDTKVETKVQQKPSSEPKKDAPKPEVKKEESKKDVPKDVEKASDAKEQKS